MEGAQKPKFLSAFDGYFVLELVTYGILSIFSDVPICMPSTDGSRIIFDCAHINHQNQWLHQMKFYPKA